MPRHTVHSDMMQICRRQRIVGWACAFALALVAQAGLLETPASAQATSARQKPPVTSDGRLYNLTNKPFTFNLHRSDGVKWSTDYVIQPGKFFGVQSLRPGDKSEIMGISGNGRGFVIVRYREPKLGGFMTLRLPAENPASQQLQPTWFAVEDASGMIRLIQEAGVEQAQAVQENLKKQTPLTADEIERMKHMLRANWVLTN